MIEHLKQIFRAFQDFIANLTYSILQKTGLDSYYKKYPKRFFFVLTIILVSLFLSITVYGKIVIKEKVLLPQRELYSFDLDQDLLPPAEPLFNEDYYVNREQKEQWNDDEIAEWFTIPNEYMIEKLHEDNRRLVQKIMEVSP